MSTTRSHGTEKKPTTLETAIKEMRSRYQVSVKIPVKWGEMDAYNHLNNVAMLRYFESARIAYFNIFQRYLLDKEHQAFINPSIPLEDYDFSQIGPIMKDNYCRYRRQVKYPDTLHVFAGVSPSKIEKNSYIMDYSAISTTDKGAVVAEGHSTIVILNYAKGVKANFPPKLYDLMLAVTNKDWNALKRFKELRAASLTGTETYVKDEFEETLDDWHHEEEGAIKFM